MKHELSEKDKVEVLELLRRRVRASLMTLPIATKTPQNSCNNAFFGLEDALFGDAKSMV